MEGRIISILHRIRGLVRRPAFSPLTARLLSEIESRLEPAAGELLARQREAMNLVQSHARGRELCYYAMRGGRPRRDPSLQFPNCLRELKLATVKFRCPGNSKLWAVDVFLVEGYFFSLVFDSPSERIQDQAEIEVLELGLHADPMKPVSPTVPVSERAHEVGLTGWLAESARRYGVRDTRPPLSIEQRQIRIEELGASLPADYLALVEQSDGLVVGECAILGLADIYQVVMEEADYIVLAQIGGRGVLAARAGEVDGQTYILDFEGTPARRLGSFRAGVESVLQYQEPGPR